MFLVVLGLIALVSLLLILIVLVQNSKGGGATSFASSTSNLIGVKRTGDLLENITWGLAAALLVLCLSTNFILDRDGDGQTEVPGSVNIERAQESGFQPQQPAPAAQPQEQPATQGE